MTPATAAMSRDPIERPISVTLIGHQCVYEEGDKCIDEAIRDSLRQLATQARVELLTATFVQTPTATQFAGASTWVDVSRREIGDAIIDHLAMQA